MTVSLPALPKFQHLDVEKIPEQLSALFLQHQTQLEKLLKNARGHYTWENLISPLDIMGDEWHKIIGPLSHLNGVANTKKVRAAYQKCLPILTEYALTFSHHQGLYNAVKQISESTEFSHLNTTKQKIIHDELIDFKLAGIALNETDKKRFKEIQQQLSVLCNQFENHLLDATQAWKKHIQQETDLSGIPPHTLQEAIALAKKENQTGWLFSLEAPVYQAIMMYADNRTLRETFYHAYTTRASQLSPSGAQWDNTQIMQDILKLRHEEATLLGYTNYAELSLAKKMAKEPKNVFDFLDTLIPKVKPQAKKELHQLEIFAREKLSLEKLEPWDVGYASEKLREAAYSVSQNEFRPYLPHRVALEGLFVIAGKLYGIHFEEIDNVETWHPDVLFYKVTDENKQIRGYVYIDLFARSEKRGGAWMDECLSRQHLADGSLQHSVAYLTCNFTKPMEPQKDALLSHDEVVTLFHEFGHTLHHILTLVDEANASGIGDVEWDAVELPSQFFEHWCWEKEAIALFSKNIETALPIPEEKVELLLKAKNFQSAMWLARQLEFTLFDFRIHAEFDPTKGNRIQSILDEVRAAVSVVPIAPYNQFQHGFSHIFAGGYAAGYYSYLWAEVLSSDAFVAFEENGIFDAATGRKFLHTILEVGSSRPIIDSFIAFRGQPPSIDALLRHLGIG